MSTLTDHGDPAAGAALHTAFPEVTTEACEYRGDVTVNVQPAHELEVIAYARDTLGYTMLIDRFGADRGEDADPRFDPEIDAPLSGQVRPFMCLPLRLRGKVVGVARAFLQAGTPTSARTGEVLTAALSAAVRNALLYRSLVETIEEVAEARRSARR